jgi:hypothetical protein
MSLFAPSISAIRPVLEKNVDQRWTEAFPRDESPG